MKKNTVFPLGNCLHASRYDVGFAYRLFSLFHEPFQPIVLVNFVFFLKNAVKTEFSSNHKKIFQK